jgi:hypothetical protein
MIKSIIELMDLIQKYKQEIFWESEKLRKKFNVFYKKQPIESIEKLKDYKIYGYIDLNVFLFNRKILFLDNPRSFNDILSKIFQKYKKMDQTQLREQILEYIFKFIYNIIESIILIDKLFKIAPKTDKDLIVYRGLNIENEYLEDKMSLSLLKLKKGDLYIFPNYLSTSLLNDYALKFLGSKFINKSNSTPGCCFFKIFIPKNTRILYMDTNMIQSLRLQTNKILLSGIEYEVLLPRSSVLKFIKRYIISGTIPQTCEISNINKGKINDIYVYEFEYISVDKDREKFNLKKMNNPEYLQKILKNIDNINLYITKDNLVDHLQRKKMFQ